MFILTFLFVLVVLIVILVRFGILGKVVKWIFFAIVFCVAIAFAGAFVFLDDIKDATRDQYERYRSKQIETAMPQECMRVGVDKRVCQVYIQGLYNSMKGKTSGLYTEKTWDDYIFGTEPKSNLAKEIAAIINAEGRRFIIAQARIDKNMCNILSGMIQDINPNEFACEKAGITMKELGGFLYDLKYLFLLISGRLNYY